MNRLSTSRFLIVLGAALALACSPAPNILPTNDFNRPTDIAFMCLGAFGTEMSDGDGGVVETGPFQVSGRPMKACHNPPVTDMQQKPIKASIHNRTFAFVPSSASGDLSVIDANAWKIVDLNRATGGYGRVPLGAQPEQISTTTDGCRLVSANRGSCDLTLVDPSALLAGVFAAQYGQDIKPPSGNGLQRITPHWPDANGTPMHSAPYEVVFLPRTTNGLEGSNQLCPADGSAAPNQWQALVTFPSCDLIALIDLPSGEIKASAKVVEIDVANPDGSTSKVASLEPAGTSPQCPADCGSGRAPADAGTDADDGSTPDDGAASDGGAAPPAKLPAVPKDAGFRPAGIAITPQGDRAYVSLSSYSGLVSIGLSPDALTLPSKGIVLKNAQGSNRVRLSVNPWAYELPDHPGRFVGDKGRQYLYAIARDGSLRIVDVSVPGSEEECATNFDPLTNRDANGKPLYTADLACVPFTAKPRQYSTDTIGLRFPTMPIDVAAADLTATNVEETVNGAYAWVLTASGAIYLVNIDPDQRQIRAVVRENQTTLFDPAHPPNTSERFVYKDGTAASGTTLVSEPQPFPNRPRDRNFISFAPSLDPALGPTRLDLPPLGVIGGPYIEPLYAQGTEDNTTVLDNLPHKTYVFFPDREAAIAQGWDVTWQGTIVSPRYSGRIHGNTLEDGASFCSAGVLPGDIVTLNGCTTEGQCPLGMVCNRDQTLDQVPGGLAVTGLCMSANLVASNDAPCAPYKSSVRRYEITEARQGQLTLEPHLDEIVRSSLSPCRLPGTAGTSGAGGTGGGAGTAGAGGATGTGGATGAAGTGGATGAGGATGTGGTAAAAGTGGACDAINDCADPTDGSTNAFQCVVYKGERRCLNGCTQDEDCRHGRVCRRACSKDMPCPNGGTCAPDGMCRTGKACVTNPCCLAGEMCVDNQCLTNTAHGLCATGRTCDSAMCCPRGESCVNDQCEVQSYCADGPPLTDANAACFPQLTPYQVNANASFIVTGTQAGNFSAGEEDANGLCQPQPLERRDPRLVSRIPLRPYPGQKTPIDCGSVQQTFPTWTDAAADIEKDGYFIDRFDPRLVPVMDPNVSGLIADPLPAGPMDAYKITQEAPQLLDWMKQWTQKWDAPNACLYLGGPIEGDPESTADPSTRDERQQRVRARFRNTQIAFLLANIDRAPAGSSTIHFDVHGGFRFQSVNNLSTIEITAPARLVLGPMDANPDQMSVMAKNAPYFFVVDQRRLGRGNGGGPTRGQILRVNPFGQAAANMGFQPTYEDYTRTGGLFPIQ